MVVENEKIDILQQIRIEVSSLMAAKVKGCDYTGESESKHLKFTEAEIAKRIERYVPWVISEIVINDETGKPLQVSNSDLQGLEGMIRGFGPGAIKLLMSWCPEEYIEEFNILSKEMN